MAANAKPDSNLVRIDNSESVMSILQAAVSNGATPEALEKLVGLQERIMAKQAEMDFNAAIHRFQSACPMITKNKTAGASGFKYDYASLDHIMKQIGPVMADCGLSNTFNTEPTDGGVVVVCTIRHVGGHSMSSRFHAPIDGGGRMNDIQKHGSALSYAKRYALLSALGLSTGDMDDDGASAFTFLTESQAADLSAMLEEVKGDKDGFLRFMGVESFSKIKASDYAKAIGAIEQKRRRQKNG